MNLRASTGMIHIANETTGRPLCKPGTYSGLGVTGRREPGYSKTSKDATCFRCLAKSVSSRWIVINDSQAGRFMTLIEDGKSWVLTDDVTKNVLGTFPGKTEALASVREES